MRYVLTASSVALVALGCVGPQARSVRAAKTAETAILGAAATISEEHITEVDGDDLVRTAARALDADAGFPASQGGSDESANDGIGGALARHRKLRPAQSDTNRVFIAISAMTEALGDESRVVDEAETRHDLVMRPEDVAYGVGLVIEKGKPFPRILRCLPGSAAAKAGMEAGFELRSVDGRGTAELPLSAVVSLLRGPKDSAAILEVARPGEPSRTLRIRREPAVDHVDCRVLGGDVLYLRAWTLHAKTAEEVRTFANTADLPSRRVILDLRQNSGGLLDAARDLADVFLDRGSILSVVGRNTRYSARFEAQPGTSPLESSQVVVLVDGDTGSGAEAVAAALQDNRRATIVGTPTAADARIEVIRRLAGVLIRFPVAALYRPDGTVIQGRGVRPDMVVESTSPLSGPITDESCSAFASPAPVWRDPVVASAVTLMRHESRWFEHLHEIYAPDFRIPGASTSEHHKHGRIWREWSEFDERSLKEQLGLVPPAAAAKE